MNTRSPSILFALLSLSISCTSDWDPQCRMSTECPEPLFCQMGTCTDLSSDEPRTEESPQTPNPPVNAPSSYDAGLTSDISPQEPEEPHPCPDASPAGPDDLILNELFANVPTGIEGDANGDGVRDAHDDEFVELVNIGPEVIDLTGVSIYNDTTQRFYFPPTCLDPLHAVVVFGGIKPGATPPQGEGWRSFIADSRFGYANNSGRAVVYDVQGNIIADHSYGSHPAESWNLTPELTSNGTYTTHTNLSETRIFSPGTCADGQPFSSGCPPQEDEEN